MSITVHERRAARARRIMATGLDRPPAAGISASFAVAQAQAISESGAAWPTDYVDLHARRASRELQRMWLRELHRMIRKARRFHGVRKRYAEARGWQLSEGWYVE
jgi:hypothetical protein